MSAQTKMATIRYPEITETIMAEPLREADKREALDFLSLRPINNVILSGWILDNGIVSPQHRGTFYGCRNAEGDLVGVAMIGRNLLFEACTDEAVAAFAVIARDCPDVRMVFAEEEKLRAFWSRFRPEVPTPELSYHHLVTSGASVSDSTESIGGVRVATLAELGEIVSAHAEMVLAETGVDPLETDANGFRMRCAGRVEKGRVWVWVKDGELIFKTDIVSVTPEVIYAEGLWVNRKERGQGYATRCLMSMCRQLLPESSTLCGFVSADDSLYMKLYRNAGFKKVDMYAKIYL